MDPTTVKRTVRVTDTPPVGHRNGYASQTLRGSMASLAELDAWIQAHPTAVDAIQVAVLWVMTLIVVRYNDRFFKAVSQRQERFQVTSRSLHHLNRVSDVFLVFVAAMLTLYLLGVGRALWGALTALGVAGIIIGFATKDIASNMISGMIILFEQPFAPGDYIEVGSMAGSVTAVQLRSTTLITGDGLRLVVPNTQFITKPVKNYSTHPRRRVEIVVTLSHENDIDAAVEVLRQAAEDSEHGIEGEPIQVHITEIQEYRILIRLRFWVERAMFNRARSEVQKAITEAFREQGIEFAIPLRKTVGGPEEGDDLGPGVGHGPDPEDAP